MAEIEPVDAIGLVEFGGIVLAAGRPSLKPGQMVLQENLTCEEYGVLQTRAGLQPVEFDDD